MKFIAFRNAKSSRLCETVAAGYDFPDPEFL